MGGASSDLQKTIQMVHTKTKVVGESLSLLQQKNKKRGVRLAGLPFSAASLCKHLPCDMRQGLYVRKINPSADVTLNNDCTRGASWSKLAR